MTIYELYTTGPTPDFAKRKARVELAKSVAQSGGSLKHVAEQAGVSRERMHVILKRFAPETLNRLYDNRRPGRSMSAQQIRERLLFIKSCDDAKITRRRCAQEIGISETGLSIWIKKHAPFGIQDALNDFEEEELA